MLQTGVLLERATSRGDLTHDDIAKRAGIDRSAVSRLLAGRGVPTLPIVTALAWAYGIELDTFIPRPVASAKGSKA
ncbi:helix-turn-helix transcriptional regulator [Streptomyces sp. NBC_00425]|uniref:helix-turn-helix transcriptional regulator n=1 Tax=Streptomyces sp. NBC_00425 TaxID=2975740 RepID=UPI002E1B201D